MASDAPRRRRARPVSDAPIDALLAHTEILAKGWLIALLEQAPLHEAPGISTEALTREGPRVVDAVIRALADDADLGRLQAGGPLRPLAARVGEISGAAGASASARAVDALHAVLWSALRDELRGAGGAGRDPDLVSELAERLALVSALLREAVLERVDGGPEAGAPEPAPVQRADPAPVAAPVAPTDPEPVAAPVPPADPEPVSSPASRPAPAPLWISALEDEVRHSGAGAKPLSLLLAELEDADRVAASISPEHAGVAFRDFVTALRRVVRHQDILVCETDARAWVIARETARSGAHSLGARIAESVGATSAWSGAPLVASVGVAVLGEDGDSGGELIEAAEEARFAASARGVEVSRRMPESDL